MREVTAIGICPNNKMVAMTDNSNDHNLWVFDVDTQKKIECKKTGGQRIYHIAWSPEKGENVIATAGSKHIAFWDMNNTFKERSGIYGKKGKPTSHCAVAWDDQGNCYTGGANSHIYHWTKNIKADGEPTDRLYLQSHYDVHGRGFV